MDLQRFRSVFGASRFCGISIEALESALDDVKVLDALVDQLEVPGKVNVLKSLSPGQKFEAILGQIEGFRRASTSRWFEVPAGEVLAASLWRADKLGERVRAQIFFDVKRESDLLAPVAAWLVDGGFQAFDEVPLGRCRADALGYREGGVLRAEHAVAIEMKNDDAQLRRALDQMATFRDYAHRVYLAAAPALIADHLDRHCEGVKVPRWDGDVLYRKLKDFGFGLLIVERDRVVEFIKPRSNEPSDKKLDEVRSALRGRNIR